MKNAVFLAALLAALPGTALAGLGGNQPPTGPGNPGPGYPKPAGAIDTVCSASFTRNVSWVIPPNGYTCKSPVPLCIATYTATNQKWDAKLNKFTYDCTPPSNPPK
jgi:hypothetical protein